MSKFRLGIMASGHQFPRWAADAIDCLMEIPELEVCLLIVEGRRRLGAPVDQRPAWKRLLNAVKDRSLASKMLARLNWLDSKSLWTHYVRWQQRHQRVPAQMPVDLSRQLAQIPLITCDTQAKGRFAEVFLEADVEKIRSYQLDAILKFGFNILHGQVLEAARYGVWSYHHDDHLKYRGGPPGFWEIFLGDPWSGAMLQRITEVLDDGEVLHKEHFRTMLQSYSFNLDRLWSGSACWPALQVLQKLHPELDTRGPVSSRSAAPIYRRPTNLQMLQFSARVLKNKLQERRQPQGPPREHWALGICKGGPDQLIDQSELLEPQWLCTEPGTFCADPFIVRQGSRDYLFFEKFHYSTGKGCIAVTSTQDWQSFSAVETTLVNKDQHYSYPMVFESPEGFFCIPEQHQQKQIALYEITDFPMGWKKRQVLLDNFAGLDPTIYFDGELWWLLVGGPDLKVDRLYAFYASKVTGPWKPHAHNPIVETKARRSRPAGSIFQHKGKLYRPAQYGYRYYGYGLLLYQIEELTPLAYRESLARVLVPQPSWSFADGLHHLAVGENCCIIDAKNHFRGTFATLPRNTKALYS